MDSVGDSGALNHSLNRGKRKVDITFARNMVFYCALNKKKNIQGAYYGIV